MRHPVGVALASAALLLAAAAPLLWTTLTGPNADFVPPRPAAYEANSYVEAHYPRDVTEAVTVTVDGPASRAAAGRLQPPGRWRPTASPAARPSSAPPTGSPTPTSRSPGRRSPRQSQDTVQRDPRPRPARPRRRALVSGNTAGFIDQKQSLADHLPLVVAIIAVTTLVLLFLLTGSVILPLKTLLMNAMTLGAAFGIVVLAFQEGWLDGLFDYTGPAAVEVTSLVFLFAVIFGLATDYAVLVMARIKEQHDLGKSNEEAVATGIGRTGRVITAAAVCIAVVFLAFGVSTVFFMKQIAVGAGGRRPARRDDRPRAARPLADAPARRLELVGAGAAAPPPGALRLLRGLDRPSPRPSRESGCTHLRPRRCVCGRLPPVNFIEDVRRTVPGGAAGR